MYVFLIGTGRCGSTLVHQLLARHPDVGFISNLGGPRAGPAGRRRRSGNALYRHAPVPDSGTSWLRYAPSEAYWALAREVPSPGRPGLVAGCRWRVEEAFEQAKGEVGLGHYQVHQYGARYRHVRLAIVAHGFLAVTRASVEHLTAGVGGRRGDRAGCWSR